MSATALYTDLSHYYDLMCADIDYQAQSHCVRRLHQLFGNQGRRHLDLACGTGPHVRHFLDFGYRSAGLDINQPMLDLARQRCPEAHFSRQDMAGFQVDEPLDLITCFLYSIHYNAGLERLRACLASVHGALADGGVFCFNTVDKGLWGGGHIGACQKRVGMAGGLGGLRVARFRYAAQFWKKPLWNDHFIKNYVRCLT